MKEFKYKGAIVKPYEPFFYGTSEKFFHGSMGGGSENVACRRSATSGNN